MLVVFSSMGSLSAVRIPTPRTINQSEKVGLPFWYVGIQSTFSGFLAMLSNWRTRCAKTHAVTPNFAITITS